MVQVDFTSHLFQGIFARSIAKPHHPVEPASINPRPIKAGIIMKSGEVNNDKITLALRVNPIVSCTCCIKGSRFFMEVRVGRPAFCQACIPPSTLLTL